MTNVRPRGENYSFRDRPVEGLHGNAGVKSTTGTNLTYLVIALTFYALCDTRDLLNNDDDISEKQVRGSLFTKNNQCSVIYIDSLQSLINL